MHEDNLQRFITEWDGLLLSCREIPDKRILKALFLEQVQRHPWLRQDMHEYDKMANNDTNKSYDWLRSRVLAALERYRLQRNQNMLKHDSERELALSARARQHSRDAGDRPPRGASRASTS